MVKLKKYLKLLDYVDIPIVAFAGSALGFYFDGVWVTTLGSLIEAGKGQLFSFKSIMAGLLCFAISALIILVAYLYWMLVPRRLGVVYPAMTGFGAVIALMTLFSTMVLGVGLYSYLIYGPL